MCLTFFLFSLLIEAALILSLLLLLLNLSFQLEFARLMTVQCDIANSLFKKIIKKETDRQKKTMIKNV